MPPLQKLPIGSKVIYGENDFQEARCGNCKHLLFKYAGNVDVEVICHSCRRINYVGKDPFSQNAPRGKDFQSRSIDHRCAKCTRLMFRSIGEGEMEKKCEYCKTTMRYDTILMRRGDQVFPVKDKTLGL